MEPRETDLSEIRQKLKTLLVDHLNLQDVTAEQIQDDAPLFGGDVGLDSLDAVEIVVILQRHFGVEIKDMDVGKRVFYSINTLADYIHENTHS
mgnify:CR=1 FL=1